MPNDPRWRLLMTRWPRLSTELKCFIVEYARSTIPHASEAWLKHGGVEAETEALDILQRFARPAVRR
jgi:hypothetical protein